VRELFLLRTKDTLADRQILISRLGLKNFYKNIKSCASTETIDFQFVRV